jgi:hypothetical protein
MKQLSIPRSLTLSVFASLLMLLSACVNSLPQQQPDDLRPWHEIENVDGELSAAAATVYYVSGNGSDSNNGKSASSPFRTLQKAANLTTPGDTVYIMNGTYTNPVPESDILYIDRSGAPGAYIRYKAYPGHKPVLQASKNWLGVKVDGAAYIIIEGLTVIGNNRNVTEAQAKTQIKGDTGRDGVPNEEAKPEYSGNGIGIYYKYENFAQPSHHVIVRGNTVKDFGGGGIETYGADFVTIEDNVVQANGWYTVYGKVMPQEILQREERA